MEHDSLIWNMIPKYGMYAKYHTVNGGSQPKEQITIKRVDHSSGSPSKGDSPQLNSGSQPKERITTKRVDHSSGPPSKGDSPQLMSDSQESPANLGEENAPRPAALNLQESTQVGEESAPEMVRKTGLCIWWKKRGLNSAWEKLTLKLKNKMM